MHMPLVLTNRRRRGGAPAFSPSTLFSSTAIGIWLDPSDLTTMFSDRAGTTPVTTPGTVVGLRLDKSKGLVVSSTDTLNGKGDFSDPAYWTDANSVSTITGGQLVFSGASLVGGKFSPDSPATLAIGSYYEISFDVVSISQGGIKVWAGTSQPSYTATTSGRHTYRSLCTGDVRARVYNNGTATTAVVDNVTFKLISGNHAVAPTDAARPIYGVEPKGGRRSLLLQTEAFGSSDWVKSGVTASAHNVADPDGGFTASTITATASPGYFYPNTGTINPNSGSTAPSLWIRRRTGSGDVRLRTTSTPGVDTPITVTSSWQRISLVCAAVNGSNCWVLSLATSGDAIDVWHPQLELGSTATAYQRVTTAYDVTESGVATCHYVQYDGSDDSMSTSAIDFTATDKMSVFAGVRKLSDAAYGAIVELSADPNTVNGSFSIGSGTTVGDASRRTWAAVARGTATLLGGAAVYASPDTRVVASALDIGGAAAAQEAVLRLNGSQQTLTFNIADAGTGNFGNYPIYIGRRTNATLPFNGKDYGIVIVGKAASAGEISNTETWLAAKTAQVTL